jgi:hypothetical protein
MGTIINEIIKLSTSAPAAITGKREIVKSLLINNISNLNEEQFLQFILELKKKDVCKISPYNLSHNEFTDCCGCFDVIDENGIISCNECNVPLHEAIINNLK